MTPFCWILFLANAVAVLTVPRRFGMVPLFVGACFFSQAHGFVVAGIGLPVMRVFLILGLLRLILKGEGIQGPLHRVDKLVIALAFWLMFASFFHEGAGSGPVFMGGMILNMFVPYLFARVFCGSLEELLDQFALLGLTLVPVALAMFYESATGRNLLASLLGGISPYAIFRNDEYRAAGAFRHPILAGTIGAVVFPLMLPLWNRRRLWAAVGGFSCILIVFSSHSSGPLMSLVAALGALFCWRWREYRGYFAPAAVSLYLLIELISSKPAYYMISRIDLTGGSTGWHRARLIESGIENLKTWWLVGTDYTRHWMPSGVSWSPDHADITNYYLHIGVWGGLAAVILLVAIIWSCFRAVGEVLPNAADQSLAGRPLICWCMGAGLFAHAATSISISYFDQSALFFWFNVSAIVSAHVAARQDCRTDEQLPVDVLASDDMMRAGS